MNGRGSRLAATLTNVKDIVTSVAGIVAVVVSALAALGIGVVVGHTSAGAPPPAVTVTQVATVTQVVTVTVPAAPGSGATPPASSSVTPKAAKAAKFLTSVDPTQNTTTRAVINGPVTIGNTEFSQSLRITCQNQKTSVTYPVGGAAFFDATVGVPDGAANANDNSTQVVFAKDGTTDVLGAPVTVRVGKPQKVHVPLADATQLVIVCQAEASHGFNLMDIAFGDATMVPPAG